MNSKVGSNMAMTRTVWDRGARTGLKRNARTGLEHGTEI